MDGSTPGPDAENDSAAAEYSRRHNDGEEIEKATDGLEEEGGMLAESDI
jgi:hypothetical protein